MFEGLSLDSKTTLKAHGGSLGSPVIVGQGYSTLAWIPEAEGSWALPLRHERITRWESPISLAVWQLKQVCRRLSKRPLSLWDSEYDCASFVLKTADIAADKLMRVRSNRNLWGTPPAYRGRGRPRLHGETFKLNDEATWWPPDEDITVDHPHLGHMRIRAWQPVHFRQATRHPMTLMRVQRLDETGQPLQSQPLWLVWVGERRPPLTTLWKRYLRRFALEHWYRFMKQRLHWTLPKLSSPKSAKRWSDLMPLATWQLWLARGRVNDSPLPWQKTHPRLTPGRVADSFATLLPELGTPAQLPKYPVVRKPPKRRKKQKIQVA